MRKVIKICLKRRKIREGNLGRKIGYNFEWGSDVPKGVIKCDYLSVYLCICINSDTHDNTKTRNRIKFVLYKKYFFKTKNTLDFRLFLTSKLPCEKCRKLEKIESGTHLRGITMPWNHLINIKCKYKFSKM